MSTKNSSKKASKSTSTQSSGPAPQDIARDAVLAVVSATQTACENILGALKDGDKTSMDSLTTAVGAATGLKPERVYPFVSLYLKSRPGVTVATGRQGGVYRGAPPAKAIDPAQAERLAKKLAKVEAAQKAAGEKAAELRARISGTPVAPVATPAAS